MGRFVLIFAVCTLPWTALAATEDQTLGTIGDGRPDESGFVWLPEAFTCAFVDTFSLAPGFADTIDGDTSGGTNAATTYACRAWTEAGPEQFHRLEVTETIVLQAVLLDTGGEDLDLILLSDCDTDACLAQANTGFSIGLDPGTYVLVVDGYLAEDVAGPYTLALAATWPGVPPQVCEAGGALPLPLAIGTVDSTGTLFDHPNWISAYPPCSSLMYLAGEAWYQVSLPAATGGQTIRATLTASSPNAGLDLALWLFDGCGPDAACLDFADAGPGGTAETLILENAGDTERVVVLAVDALRAPSSAQDGTFTLQAQTAVPVQQQPLGSVLSGFR